MGRKKIVDRVKLHIAGGAASPAPPIGPALGQRGINIALFCKDFNAKTANLKGLIIPVELIVYEDRSFTFEVKQPLTSHLLKKAAGVDKGSAQPNRDKVGKITWSQLEEIAKKKMPDLYANDVEAAIKTVCGTARSMGIEVVQD